MDRFFFWRIKWNLLADAYWSGQITHTEWTDAMNDMINKKIIGGVH